MSERRGRVYKPTWTDKRTGARRESKYWWIDYSVDGVRQRENSRSTLKEDARALLDQRCAERHLVGSGKLLPSEQARVTVAALLDLVLDNYRHKGLRSLDRAESLAANLIGYFGDTRAADVTPRSLTQYVEHRRGAGRSGSTALREIALLQRAYRLGKSEIGLTLDVPTSENLPSEAPPREDFFSESELAAMLEALPPSYRPLVELAAITGWRRGALLSRRWSDVRCGWLILDREGSKNKKPYRFPVRGRVAELLELQEAQRTETARPTGRLPEHIFFDHETGEPIMASQLRYRWEKAQAATKIGHMFHALRRTAARNMVRKGVSQTVAKELLGMETDSIFARYAIVDETVLEEGVAQLFDGESEVAAPERKVVGIDTKLASRRERQSHETL